MRRCVSLVVGGIISSLLVLTSAAAPPAKTKQQPTSAALRNHRPVLPAQHADAPVQLEAPIDLAQAALPTDQPPAPVPTEQPTPVPGTQPARTGFASTRVSERLQERLEEAAVATPVEAVDSSNIAVQPSADLTRAAADSGSAPSLRTAPRNPVSFDPRVRGYHVGQLTASADGAYWFPARWDLDTMLSKIDPSIVDNMLVIPGPYRVRYGQGFSFIDIETTPTPRYQNGFDWGGRTFLNYQTNGEQWYGRETVWGGSSDWGFRVGYGLRTGSDYESGDGTEMPSSYKMRDLDSAFGLDLSPNSRIEFGYLRLDQTDTEYPGQVYDIEFLVTDAFNLHYELENQHRFDLLTIDTWYNRTRFEGHAQRQGKRRQIPELNSPNRIGAAFGGRGVLNFTGFTDVDEMSTGFRTAATWGLPEEPQLTFGVDLRYLEQELNEFDAFDSGGSLVDTNFGIPRSHWSNPGMFLEHILPVGDRLTFTSGLRVDWVSADVEGRMRGRPTDDLHTTLGTDNFDQNFGMWSGFITAEYELSDCWSVLGGAGHAERAPTLTELYAVDPFLAILQQGFTQVRGNPHLHTERLWQLDLGLRARYDRFRGGISGFHSWVIDYITFEARDDQLRQDGVPNGLAVNFVNTDLATLAGGEIYGEFDLTSYLTPFATLSYVEGRDHSRGNRGQVAGLSGSDEEPLPGISPLETRLGIRLHEPVYEPGQNPGWGIELAARVVDGQDRVASSLLEQQSGGFTVWDVRGYLQARENLLLVAGIENFGDNNYHEHLDLRTGNGVLRPGINFYFGGELTY